MFKIGQSQKRISESPHKWQDLSHLLHARWCHWKIVHWDRQVCACLLHGQIAFYPWRPLSSRISSRPCELIGEWSNSITEHHQKSPFESNQRGFKSCSKSIIFRLGGTTDLLLLAREVGLLSSSLFPRRWYQNFWCPYPLSTFLIGQWFQLLIALRVDPWMPW